VAVAALAIGGGAHGAQAQGYGSDYSPFVGDYVGEVVVETPTGLAKRESEVIVRREQDGFSVEWSTDTVKPDGKIKSDRYFIAFKPSPRPGIYLPTNKVQRMGETVKVDPLDGDPQLLLSKIDGKTLTVYASQLMEDGVFEVQTYERTLVPGGLHLKFSRVRNGEAIRAIEADLKTKDQGTQAR
jgi:hypothetical protein